MNGLPLKASDLSLLFSNPAFVEALLHVDECTNPSCMRYRSEVEVRLTRHPAYPFAIIRTLASN